MSILLKVWEKSGDFEKSESERKNFSSGIVFLPRNIGDQAIYEKYSKSGEFISSLKKKPPRDLIGNFLVFYAQNFLLKEEFKNQYFEAVIIYKNKSDGLELLYFPITPINLNDYSGDNLTNNALITYDQLFTSFTMNIK